jgi:hypothetical protein
MLWTRYRPRSTLLCCSSRLLALVRVQRAVAIATSAHIVTIVTVFM